MMDVSRSVPDEVVTPPPPEEVDEIEQRGFSLGEWLRKPRTLISFALAIAIIAFVITGIDINLRETWAQIRKANPWLYLVAFFMFYLTFPLRAVRWRILLRSAGFPVDEGRQSWASIGALTQYLGLSWFANCVVPAKLGDAYRGYLLKHNGNVSLSRSLGTIFAERLLDMIVLFALLLGSGWMVFGTHLPSMARYVFALGALLVVLIILGLMAMRYLSPLIRRVVPARLDRVYSHFEAGTLLSLQPRVLPLLLPLSALIWLGESLRLFFVIEAVGGLNLGLAPIVFIALTSSLLTTVPATPGGLGIVEGGIVGVLTLPLFAVGITMAGAVMILDRVINYWSVVVFGFILYLVSKRK